MGFFSTLFGGPSDAQKTLASQSQNLAGSMNTAFQQRLGAQNQIYQNLSRQLTPIANLGPGQRGGSPEQWAAENTLAISNAAAAYRNSRQAVSAQLAGQGGGNSSGLQSGISQQIAGTLASNAENNLSNLTQENLIHDYDVGNQNFWKATGGEQTLGNSEDALQFGQQASSTGQVALKDANQIAEMNQSRLGNIVGLGTKVLGGAITGGLSGGFSGALMGGLKGLGSSFGMNTSGMPSSFGGGGGGQATLGGLGEGGVDEFGQYS
jgi:hypothetical protein